MERKKNWRGEQTPRVGVVRDGRSPAEKGRETMMKNRLMEAVLAVELAKRRLAAAQAEFDRLYERVVRGEED
jgi:hypothetical protein